jgi:putative intracellular protease/amidase
MNKLLKGVLYLFAFVLPIVAFGAIGLASTLASAKPAPTAIPARHTKAFDPLKPTVVIVLGTGETESTDFLIPYATFSATGAYNVYGVAPERTLATLTGGLDVVPDFSYVELDDVLGKSPDIVVIPALMNGTSPQNEPVLAWIKQQSDRGSFILSICAGAEAFAATGLLDGRTATTHWGDIDWIEAAYPAVNWVRGVRYVDGGTYMTSAGITSGLDAVLHLIAQRDGEHVAQAVAQKLHYPSYAYVNNPRVEQYTAGFDLIAVAALNIVVHPDRSTAGVLLYDGVGELELASTFDTYAASWTTRLLSVATTRRLITTQHGLQLAPRWAFDDVPDVERLIVPGTNAPERSVDWPSPVVYLHADQPEQFAFDAPLHDLARQESIPSAVLAAKRLEYRPGAEQTEGSSWPLWLTIRPLLLGLAGLAVVLTITHAARWRHEARRVPSHAAAPAGS